MSAPTVVISPVAVAGVTNPDRFIATMSDGSNVPGTNAAMLMMSIKALKSANTQKGNQITSWNTSISDANSAIADNTSILTAAGAAGMNIS